MHCTYGPSLLWTDFIMCQINLDDHNLFSAVSYIQLLLCMSIISSYCLIRLFKWKKSFVKATKGTFVCPWAEFAMGRVCNGPRLLWAEFVMGRDVPDPITFIRCLYRVTGVSIGQGEIG